MLQAYTIIILFLGYVCVNCAFLKAPPPPLKNALLPHFPLSVVSLQAVKTERHLLRVVNMRSYFY